MKIYIININKSYDEDGDGYIGGWFNCPVNFEEVKEQLGIRNEDEIEIEDYELPFPLTLNMKLWEINALCRIVQDMQGTPLYHEMSRIREKWFGSFEEFIDHKDQIRHYSVQDSETLAKILLLEESIYGEISSDLQNHIDYASFGRELETSEEYLFTDNGVFRYK